MTALPPVLTLKVDIPDRQLRAKSGQGRSACSDDDDLWTVHQSMYATAPSTATIRAR
jgi:hypothetical protein